MHFDKKWFVIGMLSGLLVAVTAWAITTEGIWNSVYDSVNTAIRINQVTP